MDTVINYLKWPMAALSVLMFLPLWNADVSLISKTFSNHMLLYFVVPMGCVLVFWFSVPGLAGSYFSIFEHEFSHMLVALLTFHKPKGMIIEDNIGGSFFFSGKGNWLITVAPYFLPSFPILIMLSSLFWQLQNKQLPIYFLPTLGMMFGYHIASNIAQVHPGQTDFEKAGWLFSLLFLPAANLLAIGLVWSFAINGWLGVNNWWHIVIQQIITSYNHFI